MLILGIIPVVVVAEPASAAPVDCSRGVNLGFETPLVRDNPMGPAPNWALFDEILVPGWETSASDDLIELWESGFLGVPAYAGNQLAEMNATQPSTLIQDIDTLEGDSIDWFVAHRARTGPTDSADLRFGAPGAPVDTQLMVSPTGSWTTYSGTYVVPVGQTTTRMSFVSNDAGSLGNFLDGIMLELECEITLSSAFTGFADVDMSGHVNPGDTAGFSYLVSNVGSATVENLTVDDTLGFSASCPATTLIPGASTTCTASYVLTAADVDSGSVDSDATATATDAAGIAASDSDTISEPIPPEPSISIDKTAALDDTVVLPAGRVDVGDVISYSFDVTNTGNVTFDPVSVDDPTAGGVTCPGTSLASGEMMTCNASLLLDQVDIDSGSVDNTATATGTFGAADVTDQDSANVTMTASPALGLAKASTTDATVVGIPDRLDAGDRIDYTITVTNQGNVTLNPVAVADPTVGGLVCAGSSLAPGDSFDCTGSVTLGQGDIDTGAVSNTANALGTPPSGPDVSASDSISTDIPPLPSLGIAKSLTGYQQQIDGTVVVTFEYMLTNYGNVTISDLGVTDDVVGLFSETSPTGFVTIDGSLLGSPTWDGTGTTDVLATGQQLAPGETGNVSAQFSITASVATTIGNTSSASGTAPDATPASDNSIEGDNPDPDDDGDPSNNQGPTPVHITALSDLTIDKTGSAGSEPGETTWLLTVTNAGPAPAPGPITVVDSAGQGLTITSAIGNGWTCITTSSSATCTDADGLAVGTASVITIEATSEPDISVTNSATVSSEADSDHNPANDSDVLSLVVGGLPFTGLTLSRTALLAFLLMLTGTALIGVGARKKSEHT